MLIHETEKSEINPSFKMVYQDYIQMLYKICNLTNLSNFKIVCSLYIFFLFNLMQV